MINLKYVYIIISDVCIRNLLLLIYYKDNIDNSKMVRMSFSVFAPAPVEKVWQYMSKFENVAEWDPSTKSVTLTE